MDELNLTADHLQTDLITEFALFFRAHRIYYSLVVGGIAFLLQILLFYAILYRSPAQFNVFKNLVFVDNVLAFVFNISCVVMQPVSYFGLLGR